VLIRQERPEYLLLVDRAPAALDRVFGYIAEHPEIWEVIVTGGTAASAALQGVAIAGKTGTAQSGTFVNGKEQNHAWFAGIAPSQDAKIVVVVMIEFGGHGTRAARIASAIIGHYLHVKSVFNNAGEG